MYLIYVAKLQKNIEKTKRFPDYFLTKVPPDTKPWDPCLKIYLLCVFASLRIKGTGRVIRSSSDHGPVPLIRLSLCVQQNRKRLNIIWNFQKYFVSLHKNIYSLMEEDQKKHLEEELHGHIVSEPQEGVFAYSRADVYEDEPRYDFEGKDFDLPITSDEVKAELKEADRELNKPEMWTSLSCFISDFKQSHSSWLK